MLSSGVTFLKLRTRLLIISDQTFGQAGPLLLLPTIETKTN